MANFYADEQFPTKTTIALHALGHDALTQMISKLFKPDLVLVKVDKRLFYTVQSSTSYKNRVAPISLRFAEVL